MTSETSSPTKTEKEGAATASGPAAGIGGWKCPMGDRHIHREDVRKVWKECQEESFWYRALPISVASMAATGGLIYNGIWKSSKRFGPFPKLAVAGFLGFAVGKASFVGTCRRKFQQLDIGQGCEQGSGPWSAVGPLKNCDRAHRCNYVCEECKKKAGAAPEEVKS